MIHITTWRPDTCGCEIQYAWDDSVPTEQRVHTVHAVLKSCELHPPADVGTLLEDTPVRARNFQKNDSIKKLADALGITDGKEMAAIQWHHDEDGKLVLTLPDDHKDKMQLAESAVAAEGVAVE